MSASERLKALKRGRAGFPAGQRHVGDAAVIDALPELIAVVEAAERLKDAERAKDVQRLVTAGIAIGEALAALDAKLTTEEKQ